MEMKRNKLLTVSIAAYNMENFLEETLNSLVIKRNADRLEVLIVNDGSKDQTAFIAQRYVDAYPDTFHLINKENGGHGSTINKGIELATGKYFKVLDGDDWFDAEELDKFLGLLENTNADLVLTDRINVYETNEVAVRFREVLKSDKEMTFHSLKQAISITLSSISVKTKLLQDSKYRCLEHCYYEDLEFDMYTIAISNSLIYYELDLYRYRLGREGQSVSPVSLQKNINMSRRVAAVIDTFYVENINKLCAGQKKCIIERAIIIHSTVLSTYMTFSPNQEIKTLLRDFISGIRSKELRNNLKKKKLYMRVLMDLPWSYPFVARLYQLTKRG